MNRKSRRAMAADVLLPTQVLAERAVHLLERGDPQAAIEPLQRAVRQVPGNPDLHALLSQAHFRLGHLDEAEQALATAVSLHPNNPEFHAGLGRILRQRGRMVAAVQSFERATKLNPGHWAAPELLEARASLMHSLPTWHLPMLADPARNDAFEAAINRAVRPDDVVLDIGTGTGLLAMMAARAGARHVYACEMEPNLAELAAIIVARNGLADRITVIAKKSTELPELPERASLLVTETFDSLLIGEGALESIEHAREHLLTGDARIIPGGGRVIGQLATLPRLKTMHPLRQVNGFDLSPLTELALERRLFTMSHGQEELAFLTDPAPLVAFDFKQASAARQKGWSSTVCRASGPIQALLLWIELDFEGQASLSSGFDGSVHHWKPLAFLLDDGLAAEAGTAVAIHWAMDATAMHFTVKVQPGASFAPL